MVLGGIEAEKRKSRLQGCHWRHPGTAPLTVAVLMLGMVIFRIGVVLILFTLTMVLMVHAVRIGLLLICCGCSSSLHPMHGTEKGGDWRSQQREGEPGGKQGGGRRPQQHSEI